MVGNPMVAEEIVHDVFVRIVENPPRLRDPKQLSGYVRAAVVNRCRNKIRRFRLERLHANPTPEQVTSLPSSDNELRRAVLSLPTRQREAVVLRFYEDMTVDQIGQTLGISSGTVKTHLHRALRSLEAALEGDEAP